MELSRFTFLNIVKYTPLVSIDLIVRNLQHEVLLGLRNNEPAKNFWFVPGGRIFKRERISNAFQRIGQDELGIHCSIRYARFIGVYEHLYQENFARQIGFGTHYIVLAYEIQLNESSITPPKIQHCAYKWVKTDVLEHLRDVHPYTRAYFEQGASEE